MLASDRAPACLGFTEKETDGERELLGLPPTAADMQIGANEEGHGQCNDLEHATLVQEYMQVQIPGAHAQEIMIQWVEGCAQVIL